MHRWILSTLAGDDFVGIRQRLGLFGYTLVGSAAYLPPGAADDTGDNNDWDVVLLSDRAVEPEVALPQLAEALKRNTDIQNSGVQLWYIQAVACIVKVVGTKESVDLLFAPECHAPTAETTTRFREIDAGDAVAMFPETMGSPRAMDCILLTHRVRTRLRRVGPPTAFTVAALLTLRRWAKARHVYGYRPRCKRQQNRKDNEAWERRGSDTPVVGRLFFMITEREEDARRPRRMRVARHAHGVLRLVRQGAASPLA